MLLVVVALVTSNALATNTDMWVDAIENMDASVAPATTVPSVTAPVWNPVAKEKKLEAELAKAKNGSLWVRGKDGVLREVSLDQLSEPGRGYVEKLAQARSVDGDAKGSDPIHVRLLELKVKKPVPTPPQPVTQTGAVYPQELPLINLQFTFSAPGRTVIGLDEDASRILQFTDNLGTNLQEKARCRFEASSLFNRREETISVYSNQAPAPGATKVWLRANLFFRCAQGSKTFEKQVQFSKPESEISLGKAKIELSTNINKESYTVDGQAVTIHIREVKLESKEPIDFIRSIEFFGKDGKKIEPQGSFGGSCRGTTKSFSNSYHKTYRLLGNFDAVRVKIVYLDKTEQIVVPVDIETGIGF